MTEGIEDGLIVMQETGIPAWAAMSHANLSSLELPPLPLAQEVTIAADNDDMGIASANHAAKVMSLQGREVRIAIPPEGKDFNEMYLAENGFSRNWGYTPIRTPLIMIGSPSPRGPIRI